ncbi:MAG: hypothetical protein JWO03_3606 [Bacteroidetes bacterium]|nr:hypothetical protein [Bacteroidota bacterium]
MSDNSFSISTSHNVDINYEIAGIGMRLLAYIVDKAIKFGYLVLLYLVLVVIAIAGAKNYTVLGIIFFVMILPLGLYSLAFETLLQGQTPGKKICKIKVVKTDGSQAGFGSYLIRWLFIFIDMNPILPIVGLLTIILSKKAQRVGDMIAGTTVIRITSTVSLKDTIYQKLNYNHIVTYQEARKLSESEIELIKKVLNTPEYRDNYDMVYTLTNKIQSKMNVARIEASPEDFLRTVVRDYNSFVD